MMSFLLLFVHFTEFCRNFHYDKILCQILHVDTDIINCTSCSDNNDFTVTPWSIQIINCNQCSLGGVTFITTALENETINTSA